MNTTTYNETFRKQPAPSSSITFCLTSILIIVVGKKTEKVQECMRFLRLSVNQANHVLFSSYTCHGNSPLDAWKPPIIRGSCRFGMSLRWLMEEGAGVAGKTVTKIVVMQEFWAICKHCFAQTFWHNLIPSSVILIMIQYIQGISLYGLWQGFSTGGHWPPTGSRDIKQGATTKNNCQDN